MLDRLAPRAPHCHCDASVSYQVRGSTSDFVTAGGPGDQIVQGTARSLALHRWLCSATTGIVRRMGCCIASTTACWMG